MILNLTLVKLLQLKKGVHTLAYDNTAVLFNLQIYLPVLILLQYTPVKDTICGLVRFLVTLGIGVWQQPSEGPA